MTSPKPTKMPLRAAKVMAWIVVSRMRGWYFVQDVNEH